MKNTGTMKVTTPTDREIVMTRVFDAPRGLVFDALTKPELVKRWLLGPPGWAMPVCEIDLKVGGAFRYVWRRDSEEPTWGWAVSIARSCRRSASCTRSCSTSPGDPCAS